jgi:proline iminopeptidase
MAALVEDVEELRRALGVPKIAVIAHSFGGTLALEYAAKYGDRISRMVLIGAASDWPAACRARVEWLAQHRAEAHARVAVDTGGRQRGDCDRAFNALRGSDLESYNNAVMFPDLALGRLQDSVDAASGLRNTGESQRALFAAGLMEYRFTATAKLALPVLVLAGRHDSAIGLTQQRALVEALPNARLLEYERAGHFLFLDEPERYARDVIAFLTGPMAGAGPGR